MLKPRGFALLTPERRKAIASRGGKAAHANGTAHEWDHFEAKAAGRIGGRAGKRKRQAQEDAPTLKFAS
jgi:general stress protein YciG